MSDIVLVPLVVVATILVEFMILVVIALRKALKARKISGQDSREPIKETVVPVLRKG